jgi:hypothetical protein
MGRESSEKAFHRWMKIFETFPEGIALVRNNYILYSNKALKFILNTGLDRSNDDDPIYELLKGDMKLINVKQWVKNIEELRLKGLEPKEMSVWNFLMNNERGAIFQLMPKQAKEGEELDFRDALLEEIPKYITLN